MTDKEIERIYRRHRPAFMAWAAKNFDLGEDAALDVYQEASVVFVRNIRLGKLDRTACEPSTYLFAIGRNLALKHLRHRKAHALPVSMAVLEPAVAPEQEVLAQEEHSRLLITQGMANLSEKEQEVLRLYYFEDRSMAEIAGIMGYNNADVAKKMKYVSFRKLATLLLPSKKPKRTAHAG